MSRNDKLYKTDYVPIEDLNIDEIFSVEKSATSLVNKPMLAYSKEYNPAILKLNKGKSQEFKVKSSQ
jgi:hypothetical protein